MRERPETIPATTFRAWLDRLEEIITLDRERLPDETLRQALILLHDLQGAGLRAGTIECVVTHGSGPIGFSYLTYRYPYDETFDWSGEIVLRPVAHDPNEIDALIDEIERQALDAGNH